MYTDEKNLQKMKNYDQIPFRIQFIKDILKDKSIDTMLSNQDLNDIWFRECKDIRSILNKKTKDFHKIINAIGGKLIYIKSGSTGHTFRGISNEDDSSNAFSYAVKIVAYPKKERYGPLNDPKRPENAELLILQALSYFVINNHTPHIVLPICTFYTNIKPFIHLQKRNIVDNDRYNTFIERYHKKEYFDHVSILISEWANGGDLLDFIRKTYEQFTLLHWKALFFQILSVLAVIHNKFPSFRHNDMKANNILIQNIECKHNNKFKYKVNGYNYIVPNVGFQIKLWDFDFASIGGYIENSKVNAKWTNDLNITSERNQYYDIHYFFNTLRKKGFFPEIMTSDMIDNEVKEFINRVIPEHMSSDNKVTEKGRLLKKIEYTTADKLIKTDPFFEQFRTKIVKNK